MPDETDNRHSGRRDFLTASLIGATGVSLPLTATPAQAACQEVVVETAQGRLRGRQVESVYEFRGVRYAEPQTAANRFNAPVSLKPWAGTRDALANGLMAMQSPTRGGLWVLSFRDYSKKSEDCLTLNVYTPSVRSDKKRAVMFWCHGGGFATGSGNVPVYDGKRLAEHGDVVVVTVNHRLNTFGYAALGEVAGEAFADAGNAGMLDIIEALRWVKENIAVFGGDPGNVTIFGESGGGAKVSVLLGMPAAKGLFHKAIVQSGSGIRQKSVEHAAEVANELLASFDLSASRADKLREVPAKQLLQKAMPLLRRFSPVVDGNHLPRHSFDPDATPLANDIPMLIGSNETEATTFANDAMWQLTDESMTALLKKQFGDAMAPAISAYKTRYPDMSASDMYFRLASDVMFRSNAITQAERKVQQAGASVYMYMLTYKSPVDGGRWQTPHAMDLPFMFRNQHLEQMVDVIGEGMDQDKVADAMSSAWIAFAKTGSPSNSTTGSWSPYDLQSRHTMIFDTDSRMVSDPDSEDRQVFMKVPPPVFG